MAEPSSRARPIPPSLAACTPATWEARPPRSVAIHCRLCASLFTGNHTTVLPLTPHHPIAPEIFGNSGKPRPLPHLARKLHLVPAAVDPVEAVCDPIWFCVQWF